MTGAGGHTSSGAHPRQKRHAQLRHQPRSVPLWVDDPDDWALVREAPRRTLVCPESGCDVELVSVEKPSNRAIPRFFRFKTTAQSCDHWADRGGHTGPESAQHQWVKARLVSIVRRHLGHTATPEDTRTRADVYVHEPAYCLEVQLVDTNVDHRTIDRERKGSSVCWWIRESFDGERVTPALFNRPCVRFEVYDKDNPQGPTVRPWTDPNNHDLAKRARLRVFATVAHQRPDATPAAWFKTGKLDGYVFLKEILSGQRRWYPPGELGHRSGLWALTDDVEAYRAAFNANTHSPDVAPPPPPPVRATTADTTAPPAPPGRPIPPQQTPTADEPPNLLAPTTAAPRPRGWKNWLTRLIRPRT